MKKVITALLSLIFICSCVPVILYDQCYFLNTSAYYFDIIVDYNPADSLSTDSYRTLISGAGKLILLQKSPDSWEKRIKGDSVAVYLAMEANSLPDYGDINPKAIKDSDLYAVIFADRSVLLSGERTMVFPPPQDETRVRVEYYNGYTRDSFTQ